MDREMRVDRLNELRALEMRGLAWRLRECQSFLDWDKLRVAALFDRIVAAGRDHERQLSEEIVSLGGVPRPTAPDMRYAGLHYVEARYLLKLLVEEKRRLVAAHQQAAGDFPTTCTAAATIGGILAQHRQHLEELETLTARFGDAGGSVGGNAGSGSAAAGSGGAVTGSVAATSSGDEP